MAINFKAGSELTISDISDSKQLTSLISSLLQRQVIFDPNDKTYSPNYANNNNILVPQLFITGNTEDIITLAKSVNWFYQINSIGNKIPITGNTADYTLDETTKKLTIKTNVLQANNSMNYIAEIVYTDPDTGMDVKNISTIELLKITNGTNGVNGDNPIIAILSNDSHTIPSNSDGLEMNFSGANSEIKVYDGITDVTSEWVVTVNVSSELTGTLSGSIYTITNMTSESGYVDFIATKGSTVLKKRFTLAKVRRGVTGSNAQLLYLSSTADTMTFNNSNEPIPALQTISITSKLQNITGTPSFTASPFNEAGVKLTDIVLGGTGVTRTLTQAQWLPTFSRVVITATLGSLNDVITIVKLTAGIAGEDAIVGYLTNESATLGASLTGVVGDFSASSGIFKLYDGFVDKTGSSEVVYDKVSNVGCTASIGTAGAYEVSAMTSDTATVTMSATYKTVVITKILTLSKSKTGLSGEDATAYWLTNSVGVIKKNDAGIYVPTTITVNALSQKGTATPSAYAGRFIISETINGITWVDKYTSTANESTKIYTPSAGIISLRVRMYMAGGVTALVDEQNIPVVIDGSDPIVVILSTPLGSIIKNSTGNLTIEANLYKGGTVITPTSYKWYELDTSVTGGWRQLTASSPDGTTGYTTKTLTVTPDSITSLSTYKVEIVYNGLTYSDMTTLVDLSDPISVIIIGSGVYKNGQGTNTYTARLYRNGTEIDVGGTIYLYKWNLLNKDGTLNTSFTATGKTINIPATAFDDTAQLKCDVDDRK